MSRKRHRLPKNLPVSVGSIGNDGTGIAYHAGQVVHIKGVTPGISLEVDVMTRRKGEWFALPVRDYSDASDSIACPHFFSCGGCSLQHLTTAQELALKQSWLLDALESQHVQPLQVMGPVSGPRFFYRRKARLGVRYVTGKGGVLIGFRESFGGRVALLDNCLVLSHKFQNIIKPLQESFNRLSVADRIPQIELAAGDEAAAIVIRHLAPFNAEDMDILQCLSRDLSLSLYSQSGGPDTIQPLGSVARLSYQLPHQGLCFQFQPTDFVQVNARVNEWLVDAAMNLLDPRPEDSVMDLFCGIGNFSLPMARHGARVLGVEGSPDLVLRAEQNARFNGLSGNTAFRASDLYDKPLNCFDGYNKLLLDPPRSGAGVCLDGLEKSSVERLLYVSCHPQSFAEDAAALQRRGYVLNQVGVFDMFPQTAHVETLGLFLRD